MITKEQFDIANANFQSAEVADDAFVADYKTLIEYHLQTKLGDDMKKHLEGLLKQANEKPDEVKVKFTSLLVKEEVSLG